GIEERGEHPHGRCFARPVGANEAEDVPLLQREVDFIDGDQRAVAFRQLAGFNHGDIFSKVSKKPKDSHPWASHMINQRQILVSFCASPAWNGPRAATNGRASYGEFQASLLRIT